jgi:hypothetical protein
MLDASPWQVANLKARVVGCPTPPIGVGMQQGVDEQRPWVVRAAAFHRSDHT